jgi:hypothetical protein
VCDVRGLGSVSREESDNMTLYSDSAGDQLDLRMSIQIPPCSDIWNQFSVGVRGGNDGTVRSYDISWTIVSSFMRGKHCPAYFVLKTALGAENLWPGISAITHANDDDVRVVAAQDHLNMKDAAFVHAAFRSWEGAPPNMHILFRRRQFDVAQILSFHVCNFFVYALYGCLLTCEKCGANQVEGRAYRGDRRGGHGGGDKDAAGLDPD